MANAALDLTTLANAKLIAGVSTTTDDALFALLISRVSRSFLDFLSRALGRATYDELYPATDRQLLTLRQWPTQTITSVKSQGNPLVDGTDFFHSSTDDARGQLFLVTGWSGTSYGTGLTLDPVARARDIEVSYTAGYYLPNDGSYSAGDPASLPLELTDACDIEVVRRYQEIKRQAVGLDAFREGNVSFTFHKNAEGFADEVLRVLLRYKRGGFA